MSILVNGKKVAGIGAPGKSAYQAAVDGGYTKTEIEFNDSLSKIDDLFTSVSDGKSAVAAAITDKGVETAADATFQQMADNIGAIETGTDTSDATGGAGEMLAGFTAYGTNGKFTGTIQTVEQATPAISVSDSGLITASATQPAGYTAGGAKSATQQLETAGGAMITPSIRPKVVVSKGVFTTGNIGVAGDANLIPENIKSGVSIFGVQGSSKGGNYTLDHPSISSASKLTFSGKMKQHAVLCISPGIVGEPATFPIGTYTLWAMYMTFWGSPSVTECRINVSSSGSKIEMVKSNLTFSDGEITGGSFPTNGRFDYTLFLADAEDLNSD